MKLIYFLRSLLAGLFFFLLTLVSSVLVILFARVSVRFVNRVIRLWANLSLWAFGVELDCKWSASRLKSSCLYLFNHSSFFDIIALAALVPEVRFGAKIELFKIPFFGQAMKRVGMLPIARSQPEEVFKVYEEAKQRVQEGQQFALSPEGGRNTEEKLLPFKSGPFIFALQAGMPLVPVVIRGANDVMPKGSLFPNASSWKKRISVVFLESVPTTDWTLENKKELQALVFSRMHLILSDKNY
jgi:1-acyl-sn-glycerol-3-phosphate acyltransferase